MSKHPLKHLDHFIASAFNLVRFNRFSVGTGEIGDVIATVVFKGRGRLGYSALDHDITLFVEEKLLPELPEGTVVTQEILPLFGATKDDFPGEPAWKSERFSAFFVPAPKSAT